MQVIDELSKKLLAERRRQNPVTVLLAYVARALENAVTAHASDGERWDVIAVAHGLAWVSRAYKMASTFVWAHGLTYRGGKMLVQRRIVCLGCDSRRKGRDGHYHCYGHANGSCGCGEFWWWPFSRLGYQQWLWNWPCIQGKFGRRLRTLITIPPEEATCGRHSEPRQELVQLSPSAKGWVE